MLGFLNRLFARPTPRNTPLRPNPDVYRTACEQFETAELRGPPEHPGKRVLYELAGPILPATLTVSRWSAVSAFQRTIPAEPCATLHTDHYDYSHNGPNVWYVNFAHHDLFIGADSPAFAQDELQVAEHPALYGLRAGLAARGVPARTVMKREPTPMLIQGVPRQLSIDTTGIYGRAFAEASEDTLGAAATPLRAPTLTNLVCMEAPYGERELYSPLHIRQVFETVSASFAAVCSQSPEGEVIIHTGHWGGGAYGNNRTLMALLQRVAARAVGVSLVFHAGDDPEPFEEAGAVLKRLTRRAPTAAMLLEGVALEGYRAGTPDGN